MFLDDRKRRILQAIIDDYIDTAEPVGSRTIARKHELGLSSATIRNEMADLEEMGYLNQPHTSAGRIPSDKGYRLYVDQLMKTRELTEYEIENIKSAMEVRINELGQLIRQAAAVISDFTRYTSVAVTPQMKKSSLKAVQAVPIEAGKALVIVVTDTGVIRNCLVKIAENVSSDLLIMISNILNDKLGGLKLERIKPSIIEEMEANDGIDRKALIPVLKGIIDCVADIDNPEVFLDGATNIFNYPEFRDIAKAKIFLDVLDEKESLYRILDYPEKGFGIKIKIGSENNMEEIKDCSLIATSYMIKNEMVGSIGVIGPTRMDYSRVVSFLRCVTEKINERFAKLLREYMSNSE